MIGRHLAHALPLAPHTHRWRRTLLVLLAIAAGAVSGPAAQPAEPRVVEVTVRRFAFEPAQIDATVGERLTLAFRSADGVHGAEIKALKVKREIPRGGKTVSIELTLTEPGRFPILCSEYCGDGHEDMKGLLVVQAASAAPR